MRLLFVGVKSSAMASVLIVSMLGLGTIDAEEVCATKIDRKYVQDYIYAHEAARLMRSDNQQLMNYPAQDKKHRDQVPIDSRVSITIESVDAGALRGYRVYRGYNSNIDPAWIYTVAIGQRCEVYRLGGFEGDDFSRMVGTLLPGATEDELLDLVKAYYHHVQGVDPGPLRNSKEVAAARKAISTSPALSTAERDRALRKISVPQVQSIDEGRRIAVSIFDSRSLRLEKNDVRLSVKDGLAVEGKEIILDRYRLTY